MNRLSIDDEWYIVEFGDNCLSPRFDKEEHAVEFLKAKKNNGIEAHLYYNVEMSMKIT